MFRLHGMWSAFICIHTFPSVSKALVSCGVVWFSLHPFQSHPMHFWISHIAYNEEKSVAIVSGRYSRLDAMVYWSALGKDMNREIITIACLLHDLRSRYKWNAYENSPRCPHPGSMEKPHDTLQHSLSPYTICMIMKSQENGVHRNLFHPEAATNAFLGQW